MKTDHIKVGDRFRKDLGPIEDLAESISEVGLIQPIIVDADGNLIAGRRRLAACKMLGMDDVPAIVATGMHDAAIRIQAERDENICRKDMTVSELVAIGRVLEELERPKARARQGSSLKQNAPDSRSAHVSGTVGNETRAVVGSAIGMGGATYQRAKAVVTAAEDEAAPEPVRAVAQAALAKMDDTGRVNPAYDKVRAAQKAADHPEPERTPDTPDGRARHPRLHHKKAAAILPRFLTQINGIAAAIEGVDFSDCRLTPSEVSELDASVRAIVAARKTLKEHSL